MREERTALVLLVDELLAVKEAVAKYGVNAPDLNKKIRAHKKELKHLYKVATVDKWKEDMRVRAQDVVMPTFMTRVNEDSYDQQSAG